MFGIAGLLASPARECKYGDMDYKSRPNSIPWPPLLFAGAAVAALAVHGVHPLPFPQVIALRIAGAGLISTAIAIDVLAVMALRRHATTIMPHKGAERLISTGIFGWSRNPIYMGNFLLLSGAGLATGIWAMVVAAPLALLATRQLAVLREEKHLAARFGVEWHEYTQKTSRWFGRS